MANYNDIRAILQTAVGGTLSSSELDTLASAIVASAGGDTAASTANVANVKAKRDLAAVLGRVSEMRKLDVELAEKQYEQQKLTIAQIVASGQALDGELVTALQKAEVHYLKLKAAQDQAGKSGAVLSQIIDDTASTLLNLGKTGVTSLGVVIDIKDAFGELTGAADKYKTNAQEATAAAEKENQAAKERVKSLEEEAQKTGDAIGKQAELAEAKAEAAAKAFRKEEAKFIDIDLDYNSIKGLSNEHKQKLNIVRPTTIGQAQRIDGITPAAIGLILSFLNKTEVKTEI